MTIPTPAAEPSDDASGHDPLLLLASASAGRRATLRAARIEHSTLPVDLDEDAILARARAEAAASGEAEDALTPADEVLLLAREKALTATARSDGGYVVLGCDSMLELDGEVIGKPHTAERARELGLVGWVENLDDGSVHVRAQGDPDAVESLVDWCHDGPSSARVDDVEVRDVAPESVDDFSVRR